MPIYEFRCTQCGEVFEILSVRSDETIEMKCPKCSGENVERIMSRASFNTSGSSKGTVPSLTERQCSGGSCQTLTLPGHSK